MSEHFSLQDLTAWKAQQEANRKARLEQLYGAGGVWKRQQQDLADLLRLHLNPTERARSPVRK